MLADYRRINYITHNIGFVQGTNHPRLSNPVTLIGGGVFLFPEYLIGRHNYF